MAVCPNSSAFEPSPLVTAFHNIPHIDINLNQNVTEFENTIEYYESIIIWACVPILIIVCLFILMSVYFICVCCCCCCQQHDERSKGSKATCGVLVALIVLLALACCGVALWAEFSVNSNFSRSTDAASDANSLIQDVLDTSRSLNFTEIAADVSDLSVAVNNTPDATPGRMQAQAAVSAIQDEIPNLEVAFTNIQADVDIVDFSNTLDTIDFIELVRHWTVVAYLILTIVILVGVALSVCCAAACRSPACMVVSLVLLGFYTLIMWMAVGANLAYLVVAGDICSDPDRLITMQFNGGSAGDIPEAQLQYYLICDENCYPNPFDEYQMDAMVALDMVASQQDEIMAFASNNSLAGVEDSLDTVVATFDSAVGAIDNITELTNCTGLNTAYLEVLDGFCSDGYLFALILFAMACGLAVFLVLLLCFGSFYAGLLSKGRTFDDETIVYDFPNEEGPSPWQTYGARQHYHSTNQQYNTNEFNLNSGTAPVEPPKYTDLHQETRMDMGPATNGRTSGQYDALQ